MESEEEEFHRGKIHHKPKKHTLRNCASCNRLMDDDYLYELDEEGNSIDRYVSLNRAKNWEVLDTKNRDKVEVVVETHRMRTPTHIYEGKNKKGRRIPVDSNNGVLVETEPPADNTKEARKARRQARAKVNSSARSGHKQLLMKYDPEHPSPHLTAALECASQSSSDLSESSEHSSGSDGSQEEKLRVKVHSNMLDREARARILCFNCRDGHFAKLREPSGPRHKNKGSVLREIDDQYDLRKKY